MMEKDEPDCILHLVHGTFARDADWIHPDSALAREVSSGLGERALAIPFQWTGANSHRARRQAGIEFAQRLIAFGQSHPGVAQYVIAHSHGGNVTGYALQESGVTPVVAGVACLGTPFIKARARDLRGSRLLLQAVLGAVIAMALIVVAAVTYVWAQLAINPNSPLYQGTNPPIFGDAHYSIWSAFALMSFYGLIAYGIGWVLTRPAVWVWRFVVQREMPRLSAEQSALVRQLTARFADVPLLIVDAKGDEAAWWLRMVSWIASLPYRIWKPNTFFVVGLAILTALLIVMQLVRWEPWASGVALPLFHLVEGLLLFVISTLGVALPGWLLCLIWPAVFRSHVLGFGRDDFLQNFVVEISSTAVPEDSERMTQEEISVTGGGLHHSRLHQDESVLRLLRTWFQQQRISGTVKQ